MPHFSIAPARHEDVSHIMAMIRELAAFEKLTHLLECTEEQLDEALFGPHPVIEAVLGWVESTDGGREAAAYALCFTNFSTFLGRKGLYLEDLFVRPAFRHRGYARALLRHLAALAVERGCGRFEWAVLNWNEGAQAFYRGLGADILPDWRITRLTGDALKKLASST